MLDRGGLWDGLLHQGRRRLGAVHPRTVETLIERGLAEAVATVGGPRGLDYPCPVRRPGCHVHTYLRAKRAWERAQEAAAVYYHPTAAGCAIVNAVAP